MLNYPPKSGGSGGGDGGSGAREAAPPPGRRRGPSATVGPGPAVRPARPPPGGGRPPAGLSLPAQKVGGWPHSAFLRRAGARRSRGSSPRLPSPQPSHSQTSPGREVLQEGTNCKTQDQLGLHPFRAAAGPKELLQAIRLQQTYSCRSPNVNMTTNLQGRPPLRSTSKQWGGSLQVLLASVSQSVKWEYLSTPHSLD